MRERLMDIIKQTSIELYLSEYDELVDALIDNGVIAPQVKVGQAVWALEKYGGKHIAIIEGKAQMVGATSRSVKVLLRNHKDFNKAFVFGKTVFLTREDAEAALKARENNADK